MNLGNFINDVKKRLFTYDIPLHIFINIKNIKFKVK